MTVAKSSKKKPPKKPYPEFPLNASPNGQWVKRIQGTLYCFGVWSDWKAALERYQAEVHDIQLGRKPRDKADDDELTLRRAINYFLTVQKADRNAGEISPEHFDDLKRTWKEIIPKLLDLDRQVDDLDAADFRKLKTRFATKLNGMPASPATMMGHIRRTKILFSFLVDEGKINRQPVYGAKFGKLSKRQQEQAENAADEKRFSRREILKLLECSNDSVNYRLRAMVLLGINAALGPRDVAELTFDQLDLDDGWIVGKRSKTSVRRCCKLWPETEAALRTVIDKRFEASNSKHDNLVFITRLKRPFLNKGAISRIFGKLKKNAKIDGAGFYALRHVCRDVANQQGDTDAARWIMGHKRSTIDDKYTRTAPRERIEVVSFHVRQWLFEERSNG